MDFMIPKSEAHGHRCQFGTFSTFVQAFLAGICRWSGHQLIHSDSRNNGNHGTNTYSVDVI